MATYRFSNGEPQIIAPSKSIKPNQVLHMAITSIINKPRLDLIDTVKHTSPTAGLTAYPNSLLTMFESIEASIADDRGSEELSRRVFFH